VDDSMFYRNVMTPRASGFACDGAEVRRWAPLF